MIVSILVALFVVSITERRYSGLIDNRSFKLSERNPYVCSRLFSESSASKSSSMSTSMIVVDNNREIRSLVGGSGVNKQSPDV